MRQINLFNEIKKAIQSLSGDKLVVIPQEMNDISDEEIRNQTNFQEQFFKSVIIRP